jgi:hypothetical protein
MILWIPYISRPLGRGRRQRTELVFVLLPAELAGHQTNSRPREGPRDRGEGRGEGGERGGGTHKSVTQCITRRLRLMQDVERGAYFLHAGDPRGSNHDGRADGEAGNHSPVGISRAYCQAAEEVPSTSYSIPRGSYVKVALPVWAKSWRAHDIQPPKSRSELLFRWLPCANGSHRQKTVRSNGRTNEGGASPGLHHPNCTAKNHGPALLPPRCRPDDRRVGWRSPSPGGLGRPLQWALGRAGFLYVSQRTPPPAARCRRQHPCQRLRGADDRLFLAAAAAGNSIWGNEGRLADVSSGVVCLVSERLDVSQPGSIRVFCYETSVKSCHGRMVFSLVLALDLR